MESVDHKKQLAAISPKAKDEVVKDKTAKLKQVDEQDHRSMYDGTHLVEVVGDKFVCQLCQETHRWCLQMGRGRFNSARPGYSNNATDGDGPSKGKKAVLKKSFTAGRPCMSWSRIENLCRAKGLVATRRPDLIFECSTDTERHLGCPCCSMEQQSLQPRRLCLWPLLKQVTQVLR